MRSSSIARALLLGGDASLSSLLRDVLAELGIALESGAPAGGCPDLVLVHVERGESLQRRLQRARELSPQRPIIALVPFADERLMGLALRLGARDCFALGRPLGELRRVLLAHVPGHPSSVFISPGGAVPPSTESPHD
ncbi:DNA-binding response regulator [Myxococcus sp. SDU36]|uniref:DNA-binding response regulator n=1 Tax=Myxococcus sp. SDU36 TaxID=2831967 RepID=UPI0025436EBA|nr:DNA-binding response regulator [Myxococcus sp. SDU36]WIG97768.1 DNA-binding response regulator [Myxococcus sp. SDU36]